MARAEAEPKYKRKPTSVNPNALALSIRAFCVLHDLSEDMFFKMQRDGWGPATMKVGSRTLISQEAAAAWRAECEAATTRLNKEMRNPRQAAGGSTRSRNSTPRTTAVTRKKNPDAAVM